MQHRDPVGLGHGGDHRRLPVRHEPGVHVGLDHERPGHGPVAAEGHLVARGVEGEAAARAAERVQVGRQVGLPHAVHGDLPVGGQRQAGPGRGLDAVRDRRVLCAVEAVDPGDLDDPVRAHGDQGAHPLQDGDEVDDLRFGRGVVQLRVAAGHDGPEQELLGGPDAREGQFDDRAAEPADLGGQRVSRVGALARRAERPQHVEVLVDGAFPDAAAPGLPDHGAAGPVQERRARQHGDAAAAVEVLEVDRARGVDVARLDAQLPVLRLGRAAAECLEEVADEFRVDDFRHVVDDDRLFGQKRGDHQFGYRVLRPANPDGAPQRDPTGEFQDVGIAHVPRSSTQQPGRLRTLHGRARQYSRAAPRPPTVRSTADALAQ